MWNGQQNTEAYANDVQVIQTMLASMYIFIKSEQSKPTQPQQYYNTLSSYQALRNTAMNNNYDSLPPLSPTTSTTSTTQVGSRINTTPTLVSTPSSSSSTTIVFGTCDKLEELIQRLNIYLSLLSNPSKYQSSTPPPPSNFQSISTSAKQTFIKYLHSGALKWLIALADDTYNSYLSMYIYCVYLMCVFSMCICIYICVIYFFKYNYLTYTNR